MISGSSASLPRWRRETRGKAADKDASLVRLPLPSSRGGGDVILGHSGFI